MGDRYGPLVVSESPMKPQELRGKVVAVPGEMTTAFLILRIFEPDFIPLVVPFDKIFETVMRRKAEAGLIIHEGQLTFPTLGLHKVIDLGEWWYKETQLPLPLGGNVIRKDLGRDLIAKVSKILRQSIEYALEHRDEALNYAMQFARDMEHHLADKFVGSYVNDRTLNYGTAERKAVQLLLNLGHERNIIRQPIQVEFAD
jgi:1,4-dihydroxy-6-naphthoate synthase